MKWIALALLLACAPEEEETPPPQTAHRRSTPKPAPTRTYDQQACMKGDLDECSPETRPLVEAQLQRNEDAKKIALCAQGDDSACSPEEQERRRQEKERMAKVKAQQDAIAEQERKEAARRETVEYQTCLHAASVQVLEADLVRQKSNPAGTVNLVELHKTGEMLQIEREYLKASKAQFQKEKGRAFTLKDCEGKYP
jgi:hypothetical protein